jgi:hypothetical protein
MKGQERFWVLVILTGAWTAKVVRRTLLLSSLEFTLESEKMEISSSDLDQQGGRQTFRRRSSCSFALGYVAVVAWVASY